MKLGVTHGPYRAYPYAEAARLTADAGFDGIQIHLSWPDLDMFRYNSYVDLSPLTPEVCVSVKDAFTGRGLEIYCLGVYTSLTVADGDLRRRHVDYFKELIRKAPALGTNVVVTESGPRADGGFERAIECLQEAAVEAERAGVTIAVEPSYRQAICCSEKARHLIEKVGSDCIKIMMDPANILVYDSLDNMFDVLRGHIVYGHSKDVVIDERGDPTFPVAGAGQVDYHRFIELLNEHGLDVLIMEYVREDNVLDRKRWLEGVIAEVEGRG
jgi:sugar phosphate isomerase/epimerase